MQASLKHINDVVQGLPQEFSNGQLSQLALHVCRGITELHGGIMGVRSEGIGLGSTFYMQFPIYQGPQDLSTKIKNFAVPPDGAKDAPSTVLRILVVDDSIAWRKMIVRVVRDHGYICFESKNGGDAVAVVQKSVAYNHTFDVIIMVPPSLFLSLRLTTDHLNPYRTL